MTKHMYNDPIVVLITDTHLNNLNDKEVYSIFKKTIKKAKELGHHYVFHAGDFFTTRDSQRLGTLVSFKNILNLFADNEIKLVAIPGNHDKNDQSSHLSYLHIFNDNPNLLLFEGVDPNKEYLQLDDFETRFYFLPFFTQDVYDEKLKSIKLDSNYKNILITHIGIDGVLDNNGGKVESTIGVRKFQRFDLVLIGHYHNSSQVAKNVFYVGSTDARNFGEDSNKGITLIYEDLTIKSVPLTSKKYLNIEINEIDPLKINRITEQYTTREEDLNVRFIFKCSEEDLLKIDFDKIKKAGIAIHRNVISKDIIEGEEENEKIKTSYTKLDLIKYFNEYAKSVKMDGKNKTKGIKLLMK